MPDTVLTGSLTAADGTGGVNPPAGSVLEIGCQDHPAVSIDLEGAFTGTVVIEASEEDAPAVDWLTPVVLNAVNAAASASLTVAARRFINAAGLARVRLRCTAFTSGPMTATLRAGQGFVSSGGGGGGGGAVTVGDGADTALGTTTDVGIITDTTGTAIGFLRGAIIQWAASLTRWGSLTETAPGTDTASSGLNGRLQRVAQRLTSLIALLPAALVNGALAFTGDTAHGATDAGNPAEIGFGAVAHGANPAAVAAGQRTRGYANRAGIPFHIGGHPNVQTIAQNFTGAQTDTALVTIATGLKIVVTSVMLKCHAANTVNVSARVGFGVANVPAYGSAGLLLTDPGIAPGSGVGRGNGAGILGIGTDDQDVRITCSVPTSGSIDAILSYYTVES